MAVKGLQQVLNNFKNFQEVIQEDVKDTVEKWTLVILREAIQNAPGAGDQVATQYGTQKIDTGINQYLSSELFNAGYTGRVFLEAGASKLAVYLEFGTGVSAAGYVPTLPPEWQAFAMKYYINGKGTLIKHPFLLPAFYNNQFKFLYDMKRVLKSHGIETILIP